MPFIADLIEVRLNKLETRIRGKSWLSPPVPLAKTKTEDFKLLDLPRSYAEVLPQVRF